jgi:hypothetical protein
MELTPVRPQPPHERRPHTAHRAAQHRTAHRAAAPAAAGAPAKRPARTGPHAEPATPEDFDAIAQQRTFDTIAAAQAEQQREMNALRDMAMQQVKRDDQSMNDWIRLI